MPTRINALIRKAPQTFSILKKGISSPSPEIMAWISVEFEPSPNLPSARDGRRVKHLTLQSFRMPQLDQVVEAFAQVGLHSLARVQGK